MIQLLSPLVSLFKLLIEGVTKASRTIKSKEHKAIQRKLIEIQLSLEDIIENAERLFSLIEESTHKTQMENRRLVEEFKRALRAQLTRMHIFMNQITDDTSEQILKMFAPQVRSNIVLLTRTKMGVVEWVLMSLYSIIERTTVSEQGLKATVESALITWDHQRFMAEGLPYLAELRRTRQRGKMLLSNHLKEQKEIIKSLVTCSKEFSQFLNEHIKIQDAIGLIQKKNR